MSDNKLNVELTAKDDLSPKLAKAADAIEATGKQAAALNPKLINMAAGITATKHALELAEQAWGKVEHTVEVCVEQFVEFEKANNLLIGAMVTAGNFTGEAKKEIDEYAESVKELSGVEDDVVKRHVAMGIQMGLTVQKAKELEEASRKLAVLTGGDIDSAFRTLTGTLNGQARGLGAVLPAVKNYTEAQLKSGEAVSFTNKQLEELYKLHLTSLETQLNKNRTIWNDLAKIGGAAIAALVKNFEQMPGVAGGLRHVTSAVADWATGTQALAKEQEKQLEIQAESNKHTKVAVEHYGKLSIATNEARLALQGQVDIITRAEKEFRSYYDNLIFMAVERTTRQRQVIAEVEAKYFADDLATLQNQENAKFAEKQRIITAAAQKLRVSDAQRDRAQLGAERTHKKALQDLEMQHWQNIIATSTNAEERILATKAIANRKDKQQQQQSIDDFMSMETAKVAFRAGATQSFQDLGNSLIEGEQIRADKLVGIFLETTGRQLAAKGAADLVMGLWPFNPTQLAVGAAEMALGVSMGAAGYSITSGIAKEAEANKQREDDAKAAEKDAQTLQQSAAALGLSVSQYQQYQADQQRQSNERFKEENIQYYSPSQQQAFARQKDNEFRSSHYGYSEVEWNAMSERDKKIAQMQGGAAGQFDSGIDMVPHSLSGRSFILSGGEAVLQPAANRELREFLARENAGPSQTFAPQINITIQGNASRENLDEATDKIIAALRRESERGKQVLSSRGVY